MNKSFSKAAVDEKNKDCAWLLKRQKDMYVTSGDNRSQFERDYTRILHSNSFRRMKHKTQVFFNVENDHICTRMEHVLHVESVSHSIAQALGLNCELTQAIAIGHDLGHTPFGHVGERILNNLAVNGIVENDETIVKGFSWEHLKNLNGEAYFWHERNSLRMVDKLDLLADDTGKERNLNLTFTVRDGIISHCGELKTVSLKPRNNKKIDLYGDFIRSGQFEPATWEGCAVKIADKIAYLGRDIDSLVTSVNDVLDIEAQISQVKSMMSEERYNDKTSQSTLNSMLEGLNKQYDFAKKNMTEAFENGVKQMKSYQQQNSVAKADVGNRESRLTLTKSRVTEQKTNFKSLKSNNEDIDLEEVVIGYASAELVYNASLSAASKVLTKFKIL